MTAPIEVRSEPLTYGRHDTTVSYFRDLLCTDVIQGAAERLMRHAAEMIVIEEERNQRALRSLRAGDIEYRVEPNRTGGQGGYFAPPLWAIDMFATAPRPGRVLAGLMPHFDLPMGISSVNLPILTTGTRTQHVSDTQAVPDVDITDRAGFSTVVTIAGQADVSLQALEQSPGGASLDWALLKDMAEDYDRDLETQLLVGNGSSFSELTGVTNVASINALTYTSASPTGSAMWPFFGQAAAQIGDNRLLPPEVWLMRTARWGWLTTAEDTGGRPFGIPSPFFLGSDEYTPDPAGGLISWPVFLDDAIRVSGGQDSIIAMRPTDQILLEGQPQTAVMREALSGSLGARIRLHGRVAAITNRYPSGISVLSGSGLTVASGF